MSSFTSPRTHFDSIDMLSVMGQVYCYLNNKKSPEECVRHPDQLCICHRQIFDLFCREREKIILFLEERFFLIHFPRELSFLRWNLSRRGTLTKEENLILQFFDRYTQKERGKVNPVEVQHPHGVFSSSPT
jgi:hypothetical protein